jgi:hypothetical protein
MSTELQPEGAPANPSSRRAGFLSRVRSQRFSTANVPPESSYQGELLRKLVEKIIFNRASEVSSNPLPNKRHSYYQPAQPLYDTAEAQHPV